MKGLKYILIDDNNAFREALKNLLISQYDAVILAEASNAEETLKITNIHQADLILMDIMMPGINGIELTKELLWNNCSNLKIIAITMHVERVYLTRLLESGFKGCIFKNDITKQLKYAIEKIMNGHLFFPDNIILDEYNHKIID